jgi:hypothetical protein
MRKSANGQSLIKTKPQSKPVAAAMPVKQPPSPPLQNHLIQSIGFKLQ